MSISVSMLKRSIRPRIKSLTRGWVTPRSSAASTCFNPRAVITFWRFTISSARTLRYSASSGEKPRSRKTFPLDRVTFTFFTEHLSFPARALVDEQAQALPGEIEVVSRCPLRSLLKRVQDVDRLGEPRDVEHAMLGAGVNADLLYAEPYAGHRLPVVRVNPTLYAPELKPRNPPNIVREGPDRVSGVPEPDQGLFRHALTYKRVDTTVNGRSPNLGVQPSAAAGPGVRVDGQARQRQAGDGVDHEVVVELHQRGQGGLGELAQPVADGAGRRDARQPAEAGDQGIAGDIAQVLEAAGADVEQRQDEQRETAASVIPAREGTRGVNSWWTNSTRNFPLIIRRRLATLNRIRAASCVWGVTWARLLPLRAHRRPFCFIQVASISGPKLFSDWG